VVGEREGPEQNREYEYGIPSFRAGFWRRAIIGAIRGSGCVVPGPCEISVAYGSGSGTPPGAGAGAGLPPAGVGACSGSTRSLGLDSKPPVGAAR